MVFSKKDVIPTKKNSKFTKTWCGEIVTEITVWPGGTFF